MVSRKEIKKIAHLYAAITLYHLGGTADVCMSLTSKEDSEIWEEVGLIATKMLAKYPDGDEALKLGSLADIVEFVTNNKPSFK